MTRYIQFLMALVFSVAFVAGGYQTAMGDAKDRMGDAKDSALDSKITTSVKSHLAMDDTLKTLTQISVRTDDKVVYLTGQVPTMQDKNRAEQVAAKVEHVKKVVNNLEIKPAAKP